MTADVNVLQIFTDVDGKFGNPLGWWHGLGDPYLVETP